MFRFASCSEFVVTLSSSFILSSHQALCCLRFFFSSLETFLVEFHIFLKILQFTVSQHFKRMWVWAFFTHCFGIPMACSVLKLIFCALVWRYFLAFSLMITSFQLFFNVFILLYSLSISGISHICFIWVLSFISYFYSLSACVFT